MKIYKVEVICNHASWNGWDSNSYVSEEKYFVNKDKANEFKNLKEEEVKVFNENHWDEITESGTRFLVKFETIFVEE